MSILMIRLVSVPDESVFPDTCYRTLAGYVIQTDKTGVRIYDSVLSLQAALHI